MLAIIGSSPLAEQVADLLRVREPVVRVGSEVGASAERRIEAIGVAVRSHPFDMAVVIDDDETSVVAAAMAKRLGARRAVAVVESRTLAAQTEMTDALGIDRLIHIEGALAQLAAAHATGPVPTAIRALCRGAIRAVELDIPADWNRAGTRLQELGLPKGARLALIRRGPAHASSVVPSASAVIEGGDRVLLVANRAALAEAVESLGGRAGRDPRVAVIGADPVRAARFAELMRDVGVDAHPVAARTLDAHNVPDGAVLLEPAPDEEARTGASRAAVCTVRFTVCPLSGSPPGAIVDPAAAIASAVAALSPRPIERVGTVIPGQLVVYRVEATSAGEWLGQSLSKMPGLRGWTVLAIQARTGSHLPHPEDMIEPGEVLVVAGPPSHEEALLRGLRGESRGTGVPTPPSSA